MRILCCLLVLSGCADNLVEEERSVARLEESYELHVRVMRNDAQKRGDRSFDARLDALEKSAREGVVEMRAAVARGQRTAAQLVLQKVERRLQDQLTATERDFEAWKGTAQRARRDAPFEGAPFLSQRGATQRIEFPHGMMNAEDTIDALVPLEDWVAFCKKSGGRLSLTASVRNQLTVRYQRGDDVQAKAREAAERRIAFAGSDVERILGSSGLSEKDFAVVQLQPSDGPFFFLVEVVDPCVAKTP